MSATAIPFVDYLVLEPQPHLVANECTVCGARYFDHRVACANCEATEFTKKSIETGSATVEKLVSAKSLEKAIEIQTDYAKTAYEGFVAQATKIGELYADLAKETYKPFEAYAAKVAPAK